MSNFNISIFSHNRVSKIFEVAEAELHERQPDRPPDRPLDSGNHSRPPDWFIGEYPDPWPRVRSSTRYYFRFRKSNTTSYLRQLSLPQLFHPQKFPEFIHRKSP